MWMESIHKGVYLVIYFLLKKKKKKSFGINILY